MKKFYFCSVGQCVSKIYELNADNLEDAKKEAFPKFRSGMDFIAYCDESAVIENAKFNEYHGINEEDCEIIVKLDKRYIYETVDEETEITGCVFSFDDEEGKLYDGDYNEVKIGDEAELDYCDQWYVV